MHALEISSSSQLQVESTQITPLTSLSQPDTNISLVWHTLLPPSVCHMVVSLCCYRLQSICIHSMAEKYKLLQRTNVSEQYPFSWKVFSGWDHAVTHAETARLKSIHLANSLRVRARARSKAASYACRWVHTTHVSNSRHIHPLHPSHSCTPTHPTLQML